MTTTATIEPATLERLSDLEIERVSPALESGTDTR
jgi:hypothetical protein